MLLAEAPAVGVLALALVWDAVFGDPPNRYHPVAWFGTFAAALKKALFRPTATPLWQWVAGTLLTVVCVATAVSLPLWLMHVIVALDVPFVHVLAEAALLKACFALKGLQQAGMRMQAALRAPDLPAARAALGHLCSRDASDLSEAELAGATVESLAENLSDSFVAPLFYYAIFGLPGALAYRAANTLDAMFGYRGRYEWFGKTPARLDDLLNLVPARLTALFLLLAGAFSRHSIARAHRIWRRDARNTSSPNAGHPMAMMAGLLGVRLDKRDVYSLGDPEVPLDAEAISAAWRLVRTAAFIAVAFALLLLVIT